MELLNFKIKLNFCYCCTKKNLEVFLMNTGYKNHNKKIDVSDIELQDSEKSSKERKNKLLSSNGDESKRKAFQNKKWKSDPTLSRKRPKKIPKKPRRA